MTTENVAVFIPARKGSKGIKNKNLQHVGGEPLIVRCVKTCLEVTRNVFVCTDDDGMGVHVDPLNPYIQPSLTGIAHDMALMGATFVPRPKVLSQDDSDEQDLHRWIFNWLDRQWDAIVVVHCTSPLITANDIRECVTQHTAEYDMTMLVVPFRGFIVEPVCGHDREYVNFHGFNPHSESMNRQQRPPLVQPIGCWVFGSSQLAEKNWYPGAVQIVMAENPCHCDIDTLEDLQYADMVVRRQQSRAADYVCSSDSVC